MRATRVRFVETAPAGAVVVREFDDPQRRFAIVEPMAVEDLLGQSSGPEWAEEFYWLVCSESSSPEQELARARRWVARPADDAEPTVETMSRGDTLRWRPGRAWMCGSPEHVEENLAALIDFAFHEGELRKLEREVQNEWRTAEADIPLTYDLDGYALQQQFHVSEMTRHATLRRMRFARLERHLQSPALTLPAPARRLVADLLEQTEVSQRLRAADRRITVLEELYRACSARMLHLRQASRFARREQRMLILLIAQVALFAAALAAVLLHRIG